MEGNWLSIWLAGGAFLLFAENDDNLAQDAGADDNKRDMVKVVTGGIFIPLVIWLYSSPIPVLRIIIREKSTGQFEVLPYVLLVANCTVWVVFSLHMGLDEYYEPFTVNSYGLCLNIAALVIYGMHITDAEQSRKFRRLIPGILLPLLLLAALSFVHSGHSCDDKNSWHCWWGKVCIVVNCALFVGPLAVFGQVWRTKSVQYMPLGPSVAGCVASTNCSIYFSRLGDMNGLIPNVFGIVLSGLQVMFYVYISSRYTQQQSSDDGETQQDSLPATELSSASV